MVLLRPAAVDSPAPCPLPREPPCAPDRSPSTQPLVWGPHHQVHKTEGGDNAAEEANDEGAIRHEHHLSSGAHGHPSRQRGILDVHLCKAGRKSALPQSMDPGPTLPPGSGGSTARDCRGLQPGPGSGQPPLCSLLMCHLHQRSGRFPRAQVSVSLLVSAVGTSARFLYIWVLCTPVRSGLHV